MKKILLCIFSAALVILSFPIHGGRSFWFLAWISFIPLLLAIRNEKPAKAFLYGMLCGIIAYCGILYWLVPTFSAAGEPKIIGISVLLLFSLYLALYYGLFCYLYSLFATRYLFLAATLWVSLELLRSHLFTGFTWGLLGYSQGNNLPIIQISEFTGVYGVSFLIILLNLAITNIITKKQKPYSPTNLLTYSLLLISLIFGFYKLYSPITLKPTNSKTISILQGNIDQYKKWNEKYVQEILNTYTQLVNSRTREPAYRQAGSKAGELKNSSLVVWPESSTPGYLRTDKIIYNWIAALAKKTGTQQIVSSNDYRNGSYYNSAFLVSPDGSILDEYSKNHLVPFGEYMPLRWLFGRFIKVVNEIGDFSAGEGYNVIDSSAGRLGVNICFEAIFPNDIRKLVKNGAEVIINLTNDAWYLDTSAPYQHFTMNVFRAVENRRYVVRAANTGISAFIDPEGRIKSKTNIFETTVLTDKVILESKLTFYSKFGDVFAYLCVIFVVFFGGRIMLSRLIKRSFK